MYVSVGALGAPPGVWKVNDPSTQRLLQGTRDMAEIMGSVLPRHYCSLRSEAAISQVSPDLLQSVARHLLRPARSKRIAQIVLDHLPTDWVPVIWHVKFLRLKF